MYRCTIKQETLTGNALIEADGYSSIRIYVYGGVVLLNDTLRIADGGVFELVEEPYVKQSTPINVRVTDTKKGFYYVVLKRYYDAVRS